MLWKTLLKTFQNVLLFFQGHDPNDSRTMDHFGYCANNDALHCQSRRDQRLGPGFEPWPRHYFRNTGVVNLHLIRDVLSEKSAVHIFIHELGHSLGARHDNETEDCINKTDDVFLMTGDAKVISNISILEITDRTL